MGSGWSPAASTGCTLHGAHVAPLTGKRCLVHWQLIVCLFLHQAVGVIVFANYIVTIMLMNTLIGTLVDINCIHSAFCHNTPARMHQSHISQCSLYTVRSIPIRRAHDLSLPITGGWCFVLVGFGFMQQFYQTRTNASKIARLWR